MNRSGRFHKLELEASNNVTVQNVFVRVGRQFQSGSGMTPVWRGIMTFPKALKSCNCERNEVVTSPQTAGWARLITSMALRRKNICGQNSAG